MKRLSIYVLYLTLMSLSAYAAQDRSFDSIVSEILSNNQTLAARRSSAKAESLNAKAENNLSDPEVEFEHQWGARDVGNKWSLSVSQSFDWPGVYKSRAKTADYKAKAFNLLYLAEEADMRLRISSTLADYIAARLQLQLANDINDNLSTLADKISLEFKHGEATVIDFRKIEFERIEAANRADAALKLSESLKYEIIALNGGKSIDLDSMTSFPDITMRSEDFYIDRHTAEDPALLASQYLNDAANQTVKTASANALPGFSLGYIHNVEIGDHFNGIKIGLSLPLFSNRHRRAAALAEAEATASESIEKSLEVQRRVMTEFQSASSLSKRLADYDRLFPMPDDGSDYLRLLRKSFDGGQMPLIVYLYEVNYYIEARSTYIDLLHQHTLSMLSLSRFGN